MNENQFNNMKVTVYLLNSFGVGEIGGNPAGVVLNTEKLSDYQKKVIAQKVNLSETAFVEVSDKADFKVRFFTPTDEVDLCGHATIATYSLLFQKSLIKPGQYTQELKIGVLGISIRDDGMVIMEQSLPEFAERVDLADIYDIFGESIAVESLPPQIVSTGLRDIMLPIETREQLFSLKPNLKKMATLNKKTMSIGFHAFSLDTIDPSAIAHCRNFAPLFGIEEESATGSSNGALACYLYYYGKLKERNLHNMMFEQGYSMGKPSGIFVDLSVDDARITKVRVGGKAMIYREIEIEV